MTATITPTIHEFTSVTAPDLVFYVCGTCWYVSRDCQDGKPCPFCTCHICHERPRANSGYPCAECKTRLDAERDLAERAELLARTVVDDDGSPVYVPALDRFFEDSTEAVDAIRDDDTTTIGIPCLKEQVRTPDLIEIVEEAWTEGLGGEEVYELGAADCQILTDAQAALNRHAPTVWIPRAGVRINLPA